MLKKIILIKNVGRFLNSAAAGDVSFKRRTLIFAENARGKTTLCAILRSLKTGQPELIMGRKTIGDPGNPQINLLTDHGSINFDGRIWSGAEPLLDIFDSTFIAQNVYSGDAIDLIHRRNLYGVIVGEEGVRLARRLEQLDKASREKSTEIRTKRLSLEALVPPGITLDAYLAFPLDAQIDQKISQKEVELEAARQSDQINSRLGFANLMLATFPVGFRELLAKTIAGVAEDAARLTAEQVRKHEMHRPGESWLSEGLTFVRDNSCPFCGQSIENNSLITAYTAYFGQAYRALHAEIVSMKQNIESVFGEREILQVERVIDQNSASHEFWSRYCEYDAISVDLRNSIPTIIRSLKEVALSSLDTKLASPLSEVTLGADFQRSWEAFEELKNQCALYNQKVQAINTTIDARKASTARVNLVAIQNDLGILRATKARHEGGARTVCDACTNSVQEKAQIDEEKRQAKEQLETHSAGLMNRFETAINRHLDDFQVGFRITGTRRVYPGGTASSTFQIVINDTSVEIGDADTPLNLPSFKNTLSSGDRNTLALAFFLARLENDPDIANRIVVFDDPFNSQDSFRKQRTIQKIKSCGDDSQQLIVFSHDRKFLKLLWDRLASDTANRTCLQLTRIGIRNTRITAFDIDQAILPQFATDHKALVDFFNGSKASPVEIVRKIRPVLETYCRNLYPGDFAGDTLGTIIDKIRDNGTGPLLLPVVGDLEALNVYTRDYHHGQQPAAEEPPIDESELQGFVTRTLTIVGGG